MFPEDEYESVLALRQEHEEAEKVRTLTVKERKAHQLKLWGIGSAVALGIFVSVIIFATTPYMAGLGFLFAIIDVWIVVCWLLFTIRAGFRGVFDD